MAIKIGNISPGLTTWRNTYDAGTQYTKGDLVSAANALWVALRIPTIGTGPGTSPLDWSLIAYTVPAGGTTGQVLTKNSGDDGDFGWA